jgi:hypothetical protein
MRLVARRLKAAFAGRTVSMIETMGATIGDR